MGRRRGAHQRAGKVREIQEIPGNYGFIGAKEIGSTVSNISHAIRNPTRFGNEEFLGVRARGSSVELWCWRPENSGLRYEQKVRNWKE